MFQAMVYEPLLRYSCDGGIMPWLVQIREISTDDNPSVASLNQLAKDSLPSGELGSRQV